jgi:hypothetical protein
VSYLNSIPQAPEMKERKEKCIKMHVSLEKREATDVGQ